jgi:hypothetical protein
MTAQYATYTKFYAPEDAQFLITLLQQHNIPYTLEHEVNQLDKVYLGETIEAMFVLKVPGNRFNDTHALLAEQAKADMALPGFEHHLQTYTAPELQEILREPAGWSAYDIQVVKALLVEKAGGQVTVPVDEAVSYVPVKLDQKWIVLGYLACVVGLTSLFYLSMAGFFSGLAITQAKRTLKNGDTVKTYTKEDLIHGRAMMALSLVFMVIGWVLAFNRYYR